MDAIPLGARGLGLLDPAFERRPLANEDGTVWAALDGEIYNRDRLRRVLGEHGQESEVGSDAEILVRLYEHYRDDLVYALEGKFAFAVWDERERRLLIARDRFGEKSLFYATGPADQLSFASELKPAVAGGPSAELDPRAVERFFARGYVPGELSMFAAVRQLAPGHLLVWRPGEEPETRRYWAPPAPIATEAETVADVAREFGRLLSASVRPRLVGDGPVGVLLDGGLDSTLIAAIARRESAEPVKTFTVAYPTSGPEAIESTRKTARELASEHHELIVSPDEIAREAPAVLAALDQPLADPNFPLSRASAGFARADVSAVLGSEGADELFGRPAVAAVNPGARRAIYGQLLAAAGDPPPLERSEELSRLTGGVLAAADRASRPVSLEVRMPYLDFELAEFAATVASPDQRGAGGGQLVRTMLSGLVPKDLLRGSRVALRPPTAAWLRGPLGSALRGQLRGSAVAEGWLDGAAFGRLIDEHEGGTDQSAVLWPALAFGLWLDRVREGEDGG